MVLTLNRTAASEMTVTFTFSNGATVIATNSLTTRSWQSAGLYEFRSTVLRMSAASGTADILDYNSIKIEHIAADYEGPPVVLLP